LGYITTAYAATGQAWAEGSGEDENTTDRADNLLPAKSHPQIITAATANSLLRTDINGSRIVAIIPGVPMDLGLNPEVVIQAIIDGLARVNSHLSSIREIYLLIPEALVKESPQLGEPYLLSQVSLSFWRTYFKYFYSLFSTPLPWPGRADFLSPSFSYPDKVPEDTSVLFNPGPQGNGPVTFWPAIVFYVLAAWFILKLCLMFSRKRALGLVWAFWGGTGTIIAMLGFLYLLQGICSQRTSGWLTTLPALIFFALLAGTMFGFLIYVGFTQGGVSDEPEEVKRDNLLRSVLNRDTPIKKLDQDRLGFGSLVASLRRFLDNRETRPPLVISVNGPWGSGKSSFMSMLSSELEKTRRFKTVWFNAWRYHREEQILAAFLKTITTGLSKNWGISFGLRLAFERFKNGTFSQYFWLILIATVAVYLYFVPEILMPWVNQVVKTVKDSALFMSLSIPALGISSIGMIVWLSRRLFQPFQLQFKKLYDTKDQSRRIGFIDEFTLIVIDDLDRCPPDKVVEVLKTINLIVTSGEGGGRSFFVLGYDSKYILKSIKVHFKEFAMVEDAIDPNFAAEYLKKMVTLSVSIPSPNVDAMESLVNQIDGAQPDREQPQEEKRRASYFSGRLQGIPDWAFKFGFAVLTVLVIMLPITFQSMLVPKGDTSGTTQGDKNYGNFSSGGRLVSLPDFETPKPKPVGFYYWFPAMLAALICLFSGYRFTRLLSVDIDYRREPEDSETFQNAIKSCKDLLPTNPRDIIRVVNKMRLHYLVQSVETTAAQIAIPIFEGSDLNEWECVTYVLMHQRHPKLLNTDSIENIYLPQIDLIQATLNQTLSEEDMNELPTDIKKLVEDIKILSRGGRPFSHMTDPQKLKRFQSINKYSH
jgi:hypothetical protein